MFKNIIQIEEEFDADQERYNPLEERQDVTILVYEYGKMNWSLKLMKLVL